MKKWLSLLLAAFILLPVVAFAEVAPAKTGEVNQTNEEAAEAGGEVKKADEIGGEAIETGDTAESDDASDEVGGGEALHLLWDVPFGVGMDELIARVKEKTGFELLAGLEEDGIRRDASLWSRDYGPMRIAGYDASCIYALLCKTEYKADGAGNWSYSYPAGKQEALRALSILWRWDYNTPIEYIVNCYAGILFDLEQKYGEVQAMSLLIMNLGGETSTQCQIKKRDGYVNTEDIILARDHNESDRVVVTAVFNNMSLTLLVESGLNMINLTFSDSQIAIEEGHESLPTYGEILARQAYGVGF